MLVAACPKEPPTDPPNAERAAVMELEIDSVIVSLKVASIPVKLLLPEPVLALITLAGSGPGPGGRSGEGAG